MNQEMHPLSPLSWEQRHNFQTIVAHQFAQVAVPLHTKRLHPEDKKSLENYARFYAMVYDQVEHPHDIERLCFKSVPLIDAILTHNREHHQDLLILPQVFEYDYVRDTYFLCSWQGHVLVDEMSMHAPDGMDTSLLPALCSQEELLDWIRKG